MFKSSLDSDKKYSLLNNDFINLDIKYIQYSKPTTINIIDNFSIQPYTYGVKPTGLWYAFGRDWIDFKQQKYNNSLEDNQLSLFELEIDTTKFLKLNTLRDVISFHDFYQSPHNSQFIDWLNVSTVFDGIEIKPFNNQCDLYWYQTLDIASGCVWNLQTIKRLKKLC